AERGKPLYRDTRRMPELIITEPVVDGRTRRTVLLGRTDEIDVLRGEHVADIVEQAEARAVAPFLRHWQQQLGLGDGLEVAAVGSTEEVLRPQPALAKAAHALRP